jgi:hypothetical protein
MTPRPAALLLLCLAAAAPARADWVAAKGERIFGPETSQAEACRAAEEQAREQALRARLGERLAAEDLLACSEHGDDAECALHRSVWVSLDGDIRAVRDRKVETSDGPAAGFRVCTVSLEADVGTATGQPDPSFDFTVALGTRVFRDGDDLTLSIQPSQPMYVAVFQWQPSDHTATPVRRLFPNDWDGDGRFDAAGTVPTPAGARRYSLRVSFPTGAPESMKMADEYLLVVATRHKVAFRDAYGFDEFKGRLLEIPRPDSRLAKLAYGVVREP